MENNIDWKEVKLGPQQMLRFECSLTTTFQLVEGTGELFGSELSTKAILKLPQGYRGTVLTFHGCKLKYTKNTVIDYTMSFNEDQELPNIYLNIHSALENIRNSASNDIRGPRLMVCGNKSVGKTTLCRTLANYAARKYRKIVLIDANVGLNDICIPGCIASLIVTKPYEINEGWDIYEDPLVYCFGDVNPLTNLNLFTSHLETLAENVNVRSENDPELFAGGCIINISGIDKSDYAGANQQQCIQAIKSAVSAFEVNVLVIIEDGFLESLISPGLPDYVKVIRIPKSSGAHTRTEHQWERARTASITSYFHGRGCYKLEPHKLVLRSDNYRIFKIEYKKYDQYLLPVGEDSGNKNHDKNTNNNHNTSGNINQSGVINSNNTDNNNDVSSNMNNDDDDSSNVSITEVNYSKALTNRVLAISEAADESELTSASVMGFLAVLGVMVMDGNKPSGLTVLSPSQEEPPGHGFLILTSIQYVDNL